MLKLLPLAVAALVLPLTACKQKGPEVVDTTAPDPDAAALANRAPIELPPAMQAQTTQRCADGSLVYVDFFQGGKIVDVRTDKAGPATRLTAPAEGDPFVADGGWSLTGTQTRVTLTAPGKPAKTCHT